MSSDYIVEDSSTLADCLVKLERCGKRLLCVLDSASTLIGVITDSDIRNAINRGHELTSHHACAVNQEFISLGSDSSPGQILAMLLRYNLVALPVVNSDKKYIRTASLNEFRRPPLSESAFLMAGGRGTRLRPYTYSIPKPLIEVAGIPMLHNILNRLYLAGFRHAYISINYLGEKIRQSVGDGSAFGLSLTYLEEELPMGTCGSIGLISSYDQEYLLVSNADVIGSLDYASVCDVHRSARASVTIGVASYCHNVQYGVVKLSDDRTCVAGIEEKPMLAIPILGGVYVLSREIVASLISSAQPLDMPDLISRLISEGHRVAYTQIDNNGEWFDVGRPEDLHAASAHFS